jgi:hypothetical protein
MAFLENYFKLALLLATCAANPCIAADTNEQNYSFNKAPFIPPVIVEDLNTWLSDGGDQVVAINLSDSVDSNRYASDIKTDDSGKGNPYVFTREKCADARCNEFGYRLIGKTTNGLFVLFTEESGGGTGVFRNLMLVSLERDHGLDYDEAKGTLRASRSRWLIKKWGGAPLGDRYDGNVTVSGNTIRIEKDRGPYGSGTDKGKTIKVDLAH